MIVLYIFLLVIALVLIVALFVRKTYSIRKETVVNQPDSIVYDYLRYLRNHKQFNAWFQKDANMKETLTNTDGEVGAELYYEGNKAVGAGKQAIIRLESNKKVDIRLTFFKPFKSVSTTPFEMERLSPIQTKIKWSMNGQMKYPLNFALLFLNMDAFLGKDMQKSLHNLKSNLEK
jgi:hypothetical protein